MEEAWKGRSVSLSILTGCTTPRRGSPVNYYSEVKQWLKKELHARSF